jgi:hypothetical protein
MRSRCDVQRLGIELHGVRLNLSCDFSPQIEYLRHLLGPDVRPVWDSPDLEVHGRWTDGAPPGADGAAPADGPENGFGKRMSLGDDELVWFDTHRDKDMQLRFRRQGAVTVFDVDYWYHPSAKKLAKFPDYLQRKFFTLARYLVHFPVAWHLGRTRGWVLVHASAAAVGNEAVLVAGPGGAGKTTTCVGLTGRPGVRLVTENLLFTDGTHIFPLIEPIRLTDDSLALLDERQLRELVPLGVAGGSKHKSLFQLPHDPADAPVRAIALFIPQFTERGFVRPMPAGIASELLAASNRLTLELNDYDWYTAALDLLWPQPGHAAQRVNTLERLTASMSCYALGIDRSAGVSAVVDRVLDCVGWTQPAMGAAKP